MKYFKSLSCLCLVIGLLVILTGCPKPANKAEKIEPKGMVYYTFFDTVSYIYSYTNDSNEEFEANCKEVSSMLGEYHKLFDIYHEYTGVTNLCTLNKNAGGEWMEVDAKLIDFLLYSKEMYTKTNGEMNVMMGAVLNLWHICREEASDKPSEARIPTTEELNAAKAHTSIDLLEIDKEGSRVRISDPEASIDVGALGKGYATECAAQYLIDKGVDSYVLNIGRNIRIIGDKPDGSGWETGIVDPVSQGNYAKRIVISQTSCVTSGNYERYFTVDGKRYHHIIDKDTLMPSEFFASVTVITPDSGVADTLSTALFCMSYEDGLLLLENFESVEVLWIDNDGTQYMTDGFKALMSENN